MNIQRVIISHPDKNVKSVQSKLLDDLGWERVNNRRYIDKDGEHVVHVSSEQHLRGMLLNRIYTFGGVTDSCSLMRHAKSRTFTGPIEVVDIT